MSSEYPVLLPGEWPSADGHKCDPEKVVQREKKKKRRRRRWKMGEGRVGKEGREGKGRMKC